MRHYNRINGPTHSDQHQFGDNPSQSTPSAFTIVPSAFWAELSPEQFAAQQQLYQAAYEKARRQLRGGADEEFSFEI